MNLSYICFMPRYLDAHGIVLHGHKASPIAAQPDQLIFILPYIQRALNDGPFFSARAGAPNPSQAPFCKYQVPRRTPRIRAKHRSGLPHRFHRLGFAGHHHKHSNVLVPCPPSPVLSCACAVANPPLNLPASARTPAPQTSCECEAFALFAVDTASSQT